VRAYRAAVGAFAVLFTGLGLTMIVITAARGGGIGLLLGALFVALGLGRLYLLLRPR
jgi:hypothetical protein